ncbi:MAG: phosphoglycerate kinase [Bacteroidia bacterium]|nr:phosphoglycerate kinase [Bacteroidia bacterium]
MKTVLDYNFKNKRAIIRVDFNVPLNAEYAITDDTRIKAAIPTIKKILADGGAVVLMSHLGRPKDGHSEKYSLKHIVKRISELTDTPVKFSEDCIGENAYQLSSTLQSGEILLLENLRFYKEEEKGDEVFAQKLAKHGNVYVNDAFGTAHRAHASTTIIAKFFPNDKLFGLLLAQEVSSIEKVLNNAERPFTAVMGGAKVSDKIMILENLLNKADNIIVGGGMAYTFLKAMGNTIGNSLCEEDKLETALIILKKAKEKGVNLLIPTDSKIADKFANDAHTQTVENTSIPDGWMGLDIGPETEQIFKETLLNSKTILWNGPMGVFEMDTFQHGTQSVALSIAEATKNGAFSLVGGGDSVAAVNKYNLESKVSYVSTGGGAMLEYIEGKVLPGISALLILNR